jgi:hypothetical protein
VLWEVVSRLKKHFSLPRDWKGLGLYLHRVCFEIERDKNRQEGSVLDRVGLSRRTAYRLMSQGVLPRISLKDLGRVQNMTSVPSNISKFLQAAEEFVDMRRHREEARQHFESKGLSREAARKRVYRRVQAGETLQKVVHDLRRARGPEDVSD